MAKVSFFGGLSLNRVESPQTAEGAGILVASLLDLGGTKAQFVQSRALAKDYIDIDALMRLGGSPSLPCSVQRRRSTESTTMPC